MARALAAKVFAHLTYGEPVDARSLEALVRVARPIILEMFNRDSCIASTRIAIDALRHFGIVAEPMALSATVHNASAVQALTQGQAVADILNFASAARHDSSGEVWSITIGAGLSEPDPDNPVWSGHLVAVIPEHMVLIDLAIDQASRPSKGIILEPFWLRVLDEQWWQGTNPLAEFTDTNGNAMVLDRRCPDPSGYLNSPNWDIPAEYAKDFADITERIVAAMREELARPQATPNTVA